MKQLCRINRGGLLTRPRLLGMVAALICGVGSMVQAENPKVFVDPIEKNIEGWTVKIDPEVLSEENKQVGQACLTALANHLQRVRYIAPQKSLQGLQKLPIWIHWKHELGPGQYHPSRGWLIKNGYDPRLAKHVHIPRAQSLLSRGQWAKHPYWVLHELAHAYHDHVFGYGDKMIKAAYQEAKKAGLYEKVIDHNGKRVKHYGLNNEFEYFAEASEAYFGVNDFYPFVRAELKQYDPSTYALMEKVWGKIR